MFQDMGCHHAVEEIGFIGKGANVGLAQHSSRAGAVQASPGAREHALGEVHAVKIDVSAGCARHGQGQGAGAGAAIEHARAGPMGRRLDGRDVGPGTGRQDQHPQQDGRWPAPLTWLTGDGRYHGTPR